MKEKLLEARRALSAAVTEEMRKYWLVVIDSLIWNMQEVA